jgi:hypothetical protein
MRSLPISSPCERRPVDEARSGKSRPRNRTGVEVPRILPLAQIGRGLAVPRRDDRTAGRAQTFRQRDWMENVPVYR